MYQRIIGFDLARTYAILGMYIVNFNIVFGNLKDNSWIGQFLLLFNGNSSTAFVMLSGMGLSLMTNRAYYSESNRKKVRETVLKRATFLFVLGILLSLWWPADILHFYGGYMGLAAIILYADKKYYLGLALGSVLLFHLIAWWFPFSTGWNFEKLEYVDFWTLTGFFRNLFYNGWNPVFPWLAFFMVGMYLGRVEMNNNKFLCKVFGIGLGMFLFINVVQTLVNQFSQNEQLLFFMNADYLPPFLPFIMSTMGFDLMLISGFLYLGQKLPQTAIVLSLAKMGQMTMTHYLSHLLFGLVFFETIIRAAGINQSGDKLTVSPELIVIYSIGFFIVSFYFSKIWLRKYSNGVFESLMRKLTG